jgi:hypothetical protein
MGYRRTIANTKRCRSNLPQLCANHSFANSNTNSNTNPNSYSDTNPNSYSDTNTESYSNCNANPYPSTDPDPHSIANTDAFTNPYPNSNASTNSNVNAGSDTDRYAYPDPIRNTDACNNSTNSNPESNTNSNSNISIGTRTKTNYFANATNKPWPNNYAATDTTTKLLPLLFPQTLLVHVQLVTLQHMVLLLPLNLEKFPFLFCKNQKFPTHKISNFRFYYRT